MQTAAYIGLDLGTGGCRGIAIDAGGRVLAQRRVELPPPRGGGAEREQDPQLWWEAVQEVLAGLAAELGPRAAALAVDGTSGTVLLADGRGEPLTPGLMYNDARALAQAERIARQAPRMSAAHGPSSGLAKLLWLSERAPGAEYALHQADWIVGRLTGRWGVSDEHNALKSGYDPVARAWPDWLPATGLPPRLLPAVTAPGTVIGPVSAAVGARLGLPQGTMVVAGTTDSIAAFLATGAEAVGDAVTSLGSTLAVKLLTDRPVFAPEYGVYAHRLGRRWLTGGASNTGGAVLRRYFSQAELDRLTPRLDPDHPTGLDYYPLAAPGERFPQADPGLAPRLTPRPEDDALFLQGMLEAMTRIEVQAYRRLQALGATYPRRVFTTGGGAGNPAWMRMRRAALGVEWASARHHEAAYGAALLALRGIMARSACGE